ncbi:MAG: DUF2637 domain-containing protein [Gordonia sp. (in: high G+C Gram-positive bacteria)]|uniref:DUF2637 domain-containing protein n=1 Tax=Gordonia sp. (in: high G+C Gram-positive bacteria) TaxID=84139 RepID=UPI0039E6E159
MTDARDSPYTYHRTLAWALVLLFTGVSILLNGTHAVLTMSRDGGDWARFAIALMAVMAPLSLLLSTHLLVGLIQDWGHRRVWLVRLRGIVAGVFAIIAVIAFVLSFAALKDMAVAYGEMSERLAWLVPLIIDAVILAATLAVVIAESEMRLDREEAAARRGPASVTTATDPVDHPADHADRSVVSGPPAAVIDVLDRADPGGPSTVMDRVDHADHPVSVQVSAGDQVAVPVDRVVAGQPQEVVHGETDHPGQGVTAESVDRSAPVVTGSVDHAVTADRTAVDRGLADPWTTDRTVVDEYADHWSAEQVDQVSVAGESEYVDQLIESPSTVDQTDQASLTADHGPVREPDFLALAERLREAKGIDLETDAVAEGLRIALRLRQEGVGWREVARRIGVGSHNTARRWVETAADLDPVYAAALTGTPQLVVVGTE